ncbi:MAG: PPOX class F420-dependent oxidoreductase [Thermomicrobiales bacterium]
MPLGTVPDRYRDILQSTALGHLATVDPEGRPQINPVWFIWDGEHVLLSVKLETRKYRNIRERPAVAISFSDPSRPERYLEVRGTAVAFERFVDLSWVNQLARKYTGVDFTHGVEGEERYRVTIRVDSWTAQG